MRRVVDRLLASAAVRFVISGGLAALAAVGTYYVCAVMLGLAPLLANLLAFILQFGISYQLHRVFSFKVDVDLRDSMSRYVVVSLSAFGLNTIWVWLLTDALALAPWTPIVPMIAVTPCITFFASRHWAFTPDDKDDFSVR